MDNTQSEEKSLILLESPIAKMLRTGNFTITQKGNNKWPGNYKNLNDREVMNLVKMVKDGKAKRPETIQAILTEALERQLIEA